VKRGAVFIGSGAAVGAIAALIAVSAAGAGHGTYIPAATLFPVAMALAVSLGTVSPLLMAIALVQFPAYGAVLAYRRPTSQALWILVAVHIASAGLAVAAVARSDVWR